MKLNKSNKRLLIIGCPRSGTLYTTKYLQLQGLDIYHEKKGKDGMVSWTAAHRQGIFKGLPKDFREWDILHQVRHPIHTLSSFQTISGSTWNWLFTIDMTKKKKKEETRKEELDRYLNFFINWNYLCMGVTDQFFQVEKLKSPLRKNINSRFHTMFTLDDFKFSERFDELLFLAKHFNYELE